MQVRVPEEGMAEEPNEPRQQAEKEQPETKRSPRDKRESEPPEATKEDIEVEDRFQSTDN
jgi:hypothetical protein